ncbi:unnamed protein product, partial [Arabidopsis halleri]
RRRSRSKKRSSSLPPKLIGPLLDPKAKNSSGTATGAKLKWVAKSDIKPTSHIQSSSKPIPVEGLKLVVQNQMPVEKVESKAEIDKVQVPAFPFPPDWDSLSNKSKKKQLKIWHNRVRSANLIAQTAVRDENNASDVLAATLPGWRMDSNYCCSELGRIWVVWDPSVSVLVFSRTDQLMMLAASSPLCETAWILAGDFNQIASLNEHYSIIHSNSSLRGLEDFQSCLRDNDLEDIPSRGLFYTWSNHQPDNPIIRKLDRVIANGEWFSTFSSATAIFDPPGDSDHAPCIIQLDNQLAVSKKCFKYFSFLASHPQFMSIIKDAWSAETAVGSAMFTLGEHLKAAKKACRLLNRQGFSNLQQRTKEALTALEDIQSMMMTNPSASLFREEHVARKKWDFFAVALESFYRQKSRIKWLKEGDANTRFFHKAVLAHHAKNLIKYLRRVDGVRVENVDQIKGMLEVYYTHLLGSASDNVTPFSVDSIRSLHPFRCDQALAEKISAIPSDEEIIQTIFSMPRNKAPGPDGFPAEFFWDAWEVVKDCTLAAVKEFFRTGHLLRKFNTTAITLIPKEIGADQLAQFRPVACCNTIYKVIT